MHTELNVNSSIYSKPFPTFGKPKIIGYIGLENLKFAKHIYDRKVQFDLNLHMDMVKRKAPDLDVKLTDLLTFLIEHAIRLNLPLQNSLADAYFFCYRGLMTCVACTPFENKEPWKIVVTLHKGNIYLCARDTEEKLYRKQNMSETEKKFTSWGYKFEQFMLSDSPENEPNPNKPVDETEEFSLVFKAHLNQHTIVYGAEMDGIQCDKEKDPKSPDLDKNPEVILQYLSNKEFIELKTNRHIEFTKQQLNFRRYKIQKWWCQSFLVGINTILCGFRNDAGIVEELKVYNVKDLAKMSQRWSPNVCFNFLDTFFTYVKRCLAKEIKHKYGDRALKNLQSLPTISLLLEWQPGMPIKVNENYCHEDDPILPQWYVDSCAQRNIHRL